MAEAGLGLALLVVCAVFWAWRKSLLEKEASLVATIEAGESERQRLYIALERKNAYIMELEISALDLATPAELVDSLNGLFQDGDGGEADPVPGGSGTSET